MDPSALVKFIPSRPRRPDLCRDSGTSSSRSLIPRTLGDQPHTPATIHTHPRVRANEGGRRIGSESGVVTNFERRNTSGVSRVRSYRILSLFEAPDLVFARPLAPDGHRGTWCGITVVGEIDVEVVVVVVENADEKGSSVRSPGTICV